MSKLSKLYQIFKESNMNQESYTCSSKLLNCVFMTQPEPNRHAAAKSLQSCLTLCDPTDGSPPGSPIPGILQAKTLEWIAISFSNA